MQADPLFARRRRFIGLAGAWALSGALTRSAATEPAGSERPLWPSAPRLHITGTDGRTRTLADSIAGKVTAVQLMFTGCSATCPTQGALFGALATRLRSNAVQLLSISIDVLGDSPARVAEWQNRFGRHDAWLAAVADAKDVDRLASFMKGASARPGTHTAQVFVFDREARLRYRSEEAPDLGDVEVLLAKAALAA